MLAMCVGGTVEICSLDRIQKIHVRCVPLGEMARRVIHHAQSKSYCVLTCRQTDISTESHNGETSFLRLFDDANLDCN